MLAYSSHCKQMEARMDTEAMSEDPSVAATVAGIEAEFSDRWGVWLTETGHWWATRREALTSQQATAGYVPFLCADSPDQLREAISEQERMSPPDEDRDLKP
jgi:hypothetical protein